ncbi:MAG: hypothetical protein ABR529_09750 [Actinomycetota bacterium]
MPRTPSVLVTDDERSARMLLRKGLERDGRFRVVGEAVSVREAAKLSASLQPDVVVLAAGAARDARALRRIQRDSPGSEIVAVAPRLAGAVTDAVLTSTPLGDELERAR